MSQRSGFKHIHNSRHNSTESDEGGSCQGLTLLKDPEALGNMIQENKQLRLGASIMGMLTSLCTNVESLSLVFGARALDYLALLLNEACSRFVA